VASRSGHSRFLNRRVDIFCTSIVDHTKLQIDELTYLLSEHAGDTDVEAYIDKLVSVWSKIRAISALQAQALAYKQSALLAAPGGQDLAALTGAKLAIGA
jgi:hypothetical protein